MYVIRERGRGPHPARWEETASGWVLGLGRGRLCVERSAAGWDTGPVKHAEWDEPILASVPSARDGEGALEFLADTLFEGVPARPRVAGPLHRHPGRVALVRESRGTTGEMHRVYLLTVLVPGDLWAATTRQVGDATDVTVTFDRVSSNGAATLLRDGWIERCRQSDPRLLTDRPLFSTWPPLRLPGEPFGGAPGGVVWTADSGGDGRTRIRRGRWDELGRDACEVMGTFATGTSTDDGDAALCLVLDVPDGELGPVDLVRVDAGAGVRWQTTVGIGGWDYEWSEHLEPGGQRVVTRAGAEVAVLRMADGAIEAKRRVPDRQVQGWTRRGVVLSDGSPRVELWDPPARPRGAILPGSEISPTGRWRFAYDPDSDRMTVWADGESARTIEGIRGPHEGWMYYSRGFFEDGVAWISGWHNESVLVSLATGRSQLLLPFELGAPEVCSACSRMLFAYGGQGWLVAHAELDGPSILSAGSSATSRG